MSSDSLLLRIAKLNFIISGGPLMRQNERGNPPYWYLAGLVSYGPSPCGVNLFFL